MKLLHLTIVRFGCNHFTSHIFIPPNNFLFSYVLHICSAENYYIFIVFSYINVDDILENRLIVTSLRIMSGQTNSVCLYNMFIRCGMKSDRER